MDRGAWQLQFMGSQRVRRDWATEHAHINILRQEKKNLANLCATPTPTASFYFQAFSHGLEVGDEPHLRVRQGNETWFMEEHKMYQFNVHALSFLETSVFSGWNVWGHLLPQYPKIGSHLKIFDASSNLTVTIEKCWMYSLGLRNKKARSSPGEQYRK